MVFGKLLSRFNFSIKDNNGFRRVYYNFTGIGIECLLFTDMITHINHWIANKNSRSHHIACINAYCVALSLFDNRLKSIYNSSDIAGPDGMPFVKWIRSTMVRNCDRFYAPDIALYLAEKAKDYGYTFYLYGGSPDVLAQMKLALLARFPHLKIVGTKSPPFRQLTEEEDAAICTEINQLNPDILLVGLGTPKQDYWIDDHIHKINGAVFVASGATFDFFGGRIKMAPSWVKSSGFEWLYRLFSKDFMRLWKRYTYFNIVFLTNFIFQLLGLKSFQVDRKFRLDQ